MKPARQHTKALEDASFHCFRRQTRSFDFHWHHHQAYELTWIEQGTGLRYLGDHRSDFEPGDLVLIGPDLPHTWASAADVRRQQRAVVVHFHDDFLGTALEDCPEFRSIQVLLKKAQLGLCFSRHALGPRLRRLPDLSGYAALLAFVDLLHELCLTDLEPLARPGYHQPQMRVAGRLDRVFRHLHARVREGVSLEEAAQVGGMAPSSFSRFFRQAVGTTFVGYMNELRVGLACRMLQEEDVTITEVAYEVGFNNLSNFNRRFREQKGMTPTAWRAAFHP